MNVTNNQKKIAIETPIRHVALYFRLANSGADDIGCVEKQLCSYIKKLNVNPTWKIVRITCGVSRSK